MKPIAKLSFISALAIASCNTFHGNEVRYSPLDHDARNEFVDKASGIAPKVGDEPSGRVKNLILSELIGLSTISAKKRMELAGYRCEANYCIHGSLNYSDIYGPSRYSVGITAIVLKNSSALNENDIHFISTGLNFKEAG